MAPVDGQGVALAYGYPHRRRRLRSEDRYMHIVCISRFADSLEQRFSHEAVVIKQRRNMFRELPDLLCLFHNSTILSFSDIPIHKAPFSLPASLVRLVASIPHLRYNLLESIAPAFALHSTVQQSKEGSLFLTPHNPCGH